jgi:hypothetical protein
MEFRAFYEPPHVEPVSHTAGSSTALLPQLQSATDLDRELLLAAQERFERQARWNRRSLALGMVLGPAAFIVALFATQPIIRWILLVAAVLELAVVPCHTAAACRRLRRMARLVSIDLTTGCIADGRGQVRRRFGFWRVIHDVRTHRMRMAPRGLLDLADLPTGTAVAYRFGARSGLLLAIECPADRQEAQQRPMAETIRAAERV